MYVIEPERDATLEVHLLGPPQIERDGAPVQFDTRKAVALLAYLAVEGGAHSREALAALLWPEYEPARAYANLRRTLWTLNRALGKEWLDADGESVSLRRRPGLWVDVEAFRQHLDDCDSHGHGEGGLCDACRGPLVAAVERYRGDFMAGFTLRDSPPFDEWQFFQTEGLRQEQARALEKLGRCYTARGEFQQAIASARRWLALDPLHEPAHRRLMELYTWTGQRAAAVRQYQECTRVLEEELGLPPDEETQRLYQAIKADRLPSPPDGTSLWQGETPGPPALAREPRHNLPTQLTPFVGREPEIAEILRLLQDPQCRLLTLVGPGGIGKTRLALQTAQNTLGHDLRAEGQAGFKGPGSPLFPHGLYFVPLAPVESPLHLASVIAGAIGFSFYEREGEEPEQQLLNYLGNKQMLLLLDNFEHLLGGTGLVASVLSGAPGVKVMVTSRERLNLRGEWLFEVHGMSFPQDGTAESLDRYSAVQLFLQRARMVDARFSPSDEEMASVFRICRLVDGMPLGIELAAAWVRILPAAEIGHEIQRSLDFLATSAREVPERHRSLRAVCDHSWQLLTQAEQGAFRRLSVFWGGFDRQAAADVAGADLDLLTALMDKSLVRQGAAGRYFLHEVLRHYAAEKLAGVPEEEQDARDRHARYYTQFLQDREDDLKGRRQVEALDEIAVEMENVRAAWRWAVERCMAPEILHSAESLFHFSLVRKGFVEGERAFAEAVQGLNSPACQAACHEAGWDVERALALGLMLSFQGYLGVFWTSRDRAQALIRRSLETLRPLGRGKELALANWMAAYCRVIDDLVSEERLVQESLEIFQEFGDRWGVSRCLQTLAFDFSKTQSDKLRLLHESLAISREAGDRWTTAFALFSLGEVAHAEGEFAEAKRNFQQCLAIRREIGDRQGIGVGSDYLGYVLREMGEYDEARRLHRESLTISEEIGDRLGIAGSFDNLGLVARDVGDYEEARTLLEEGLAIRREIAQDWETGISLEHLGTVSFALGSVDLAAEQFQESLDVMRQHPWPQGVALALIGLSDVFSARGQGTQARQQAASALMLGSLIGNLVAIQEVLFCAARRLAESQQRERAAEVLAFVAGHRASSHYTRTRAERLLAELAAQLPPKALSAARARAQALSLSQVTEAAQELLAGPTV
jgi:predicted ATPase/DNA-binding SARP family transcriptional activator